MPRFTVKRSFPAGHRLRLSDDGSAIFVGGSSGYIGLRLFSIPSGARHDASISNQKHAGLVLRHVQPHDRIKVFDGDPPADKFTAALEMSEGRTH